MSPVTHGADTARLHEIAAQLGRCAEDVRDVGTTGSRLLAVLGDAWQGPDVEHFAHGWAGASRVVDDLASRLDGFAGDLRRQAGDQDEVSTTRPGGAPFAPGVSPEPATGDGDTDTKPGHGMTKIARSPGAELPEGLDPDDPGVPELMQTEQGRELLQWLADEGIEVVVGGNGGTYYNPGTDVIVLGSTADEWSLIHEASHARSDIEGLTVETTEVTRDEYVTAQIDGEVEAMTQEAYYYQAADGESSLSTDEQHITNYLVAHDEAVAAGATPEEADAAGRAAIRELFESGYYSPSTGDGDETYMDYYGEQWDEDNS